MGRNKSSDQNLDLIDPALSSIEEPKKKNVQKDEKFPGIMVPGISTMERMGRYIKRRNIISL